MTETVEKRKAFIINILYYGILLTAFYLIIKTFAGLLMPFILATVIAIILRRPIDFIERKTHRSRTFPAVVGVFLILGLFAGIITLIGVNVAGKLHGFFSFLSDEIQNLGTYAEQLRAWILGLIGRLPETVSVGMADSINSFFDSLIENGLSQFDISALSIDWGSVVSTGGSAIIGTVGQIPSILVAAVVTVIASIFLVRDYPIITAFIMRQFSADNQTKISDGIALAKKTFFDMGKAYSKIMTVTFVEMCIGLGILKILHIYTSPYFFIIAVLTAFVDIIPVLGTGTVLVPWALFSLIGGNYKMAIGLAAMYIVIFFVRQYLEPKIVSGETGLPPIVTICAMYIGTKTLGVLGFFILPFLIILIKKFNEEGILHWFRFAPKSQDAEEVRTPLLGKLSEAFRKRTKKNEKGEAVPVSADGNQPENKNTENTDTEV